MDNQQVIVCRGCLGKTDPQRGYSLANSRVRELFNDCTSLSITIDDPNLPKILCKQCYLKCGQWRAFRTVCHEVDQIIREKGPEGLKTASVAPTPIVSGHNFEDEIDHVNYDIRKVRPPQIKGFEDEVSNETFTEGHGESSMQEENSNDDDDPDYEEEPIRQAHKIRANPALRQKTHNLYKSSFKHFQDWRRKNNLNTELVPTEEHLLSYFKSLNKAPPSLVAHRSYLRKELADVFNVDICSFKRLLEFLKQSQVGYQKRTSPAFSREHMIQFLHEAPDHDYLLHKVTLILMGIVGIPLKRELRGLTPKDVIYDEKEHIIRIHVKDVGGVTSRTETIENTTICKYVDIVLRFMNLSELEPDRRHFLATYKDGKIFNSHLGLGINSMCHHPKQIAEFLQLPNAKDYNFLSARTHYFRRNSKIVQCPPNWEPLPVNR